MVYEGGSRGCRKLHGPRYSVLSMSNELDHPVESAAARLFMLKCDDEITWYVGERGETSRCDHNMVLQLCCMILGKLCV